MLFRSIQDNMPRADLISICMRTGKSPEEVIKNFFEMRDEVELWNRAHLEYGILKSIEVEKYNDSYVLTAYWNLDSSDPPKEKKARSNFLRDGGDTEKKWKSLIGEKCRMYVSYSSNKDRTNIYRSLLDVEKVS